MRTLITPISAATLILAASSLLAQQPTSPPLTLVPGELQVDHSCRILTPARPGARNPRPHFRYNPIVCHLESVHTSDHWEQTPPTTPNGRPRNIHVTVAEREYLLQNVTPAPVTFVVTEPLRKGWHIDSEVQPAELTPKAAIFRVQAQPGQIVRLHVGERT
jgi:hypothetical protein